MEKLLNLIVKNSLRLSEKAQKYGKIGKFKYFSIPYKR